MRTTLDIDDDLLAAAKELARRQRTSAGQVVSALMRKALIAPSATGAAEPLPCYGFRPFPARGSAITNELIDRLREESGD